MLLRLPRCATYSRISPSPLCDDHSMGSVTGAKPARGPSPVLCVDLDGTLIRGNVLWECVLVLLKTRPVTLLLLPFWLLAGRASSNAMSPPGPTSTPLVFPIGSKFLNLSSRKKPPSPPSRS